MSRVRRIGEVETTYLYNPSDPNHPTETTATREYVWGPDYVDEIVALIEDTGEGPITYYCLQDANYNVVAVLGSVGGTGGMGVSPVILRQYTYEPYGAVVFADENGAAGLPPLPNNRLGHPGLFFERLYIDPNDSLLDPALSPGAVGLYYMRNRWLDPRLGRPLQRDMNESALLVQAAAARNGQAYYARLRPFNSSSHYGDGMNLYEFAGSNPVNASDPLGLNSWNDGFDEIDDIIYARQAESIAAIEFAKEYWADWFKQQAINVLKVGIMATCGPVGVIAVGAFDSGEALYSMYDEGVNWQNGAALVVGGVTATLGIMDAVGGIRGHGRELKWHGQTKGQLHHAISVKVKRALEGHETLAGKYQLYDPRFVTRGRDLNHRAQLRGACNLL